MARPVSSTLMMNAKNVTQVVALPPSTVIYVFAMRSLMLIMAFVNNIDLARVDRGNAEGFTTQSLIKVALVGVSGILGAWGWWRSPATRRLLLSVPGFLLMLLSFWYFVSTPGSIVPKNSLAAAISFFCILLFVVSAVTHVGGRKLIMDIGFGLVIYVLGSILLYLVLPDQAFFVEVLGERLTKVRFAGLGHPNVLGRICVYTSLFLLAAALHRSMSIVWFWVSLPFLGAIIMATLSRTPVAAGVLAIGIVSLPLLKRPVYVYAAGAALFLGLIGLVLAEVTVGTDLLFDRLIATGTKTGSVEEVTTLTGRTRIWEFAWEKAMESPIVGWGAGSTPELMAGVSGHAHNILLQPTVSIGFPGGMLFAALLLWNVYCAIRYDLPMLRMTTVFILTLGIAETPLFNPLPESVTLMWLVCCFWPLALASDMQPKAYYRMSPRKNVVSNA